MSSSPQIVFGDYSEPASKTNAAPATKVAEDTVLGGKGASNNNYARPGGQQNVGNFLVSLCSVTSKPAFKLNTS